MSRTAHTKFIHADVVSAYSHCPRKAFLLHCSEDRGTPNDYARMLEERASANRASYLATLQRTNTSTCPYNDTTLSSGIEVLTEANLEAANVKAYCDALRTVGRRGGAPPVAYEATIVVGTYRPEKEQMLSLALVGHVLEQLQGKPPATGCLITLDGECHRVNLRPTYKTISSILKHIQGWYGATRSNRRQLSLTSTANTVNSRMSVAGRQKELMILACWIACLQRPFRVTKTKGSLR